MTGAGVAPAPGPLRERLRDADAGVRLGAAGEAFLRAEPPAEFLAELAALLLDPAEEARTLAALALGRIGPNAFPDLARALEASQPPAVRGFACQAAGAHGPAAAPLAGAIAGCLSAGEETVRSAASIALSKIGDEAVPHVIRAIESARAAGTLVAAADAAGAIGEGAGKAAEPLRRASGSPDTRARLACAEALGRVTGRPASALPVLLESARAEDAEVRAEAVRRIGTLQKDGRGGEETLLARCADGSPKVRAAAAIALALAGTRGVPRREALGRLVEDANPEVQVAAAAAAGHLREESLPLLQRLERLRGAPDPRVAAAATAACAAIEGKQPVPGTTA